MKMHRCSMYTYIVMKTRYIRNNEGLVEHKVIPYITVFKWENVP